MAWKIIDLFAGAGGMSLGFADARFCGGFESVLALDNDKAATKTYAANFGDHAHCADIEEFILGEGAIPPADVVIRLTKSEAMGRVRQKGTGPELALRKQLWGRGIRYRLNVKKLSGTPDLVITRARLAIFVHGCFWHSHGCSRSAKLPRTNPEFWVAKLRRNQQRDREAQAVLSAGGWQCVVIWSCADAAKAADQIIEMVAAKTKPSS